MEGLVVYQRYEAFGKMEEINTSLLNPPKVDLR